MPNEKTPMETLIAKLKAEAGFIGPNDSTEDKYAKMAFATAIEHAISLLPSERKMVEDAVNMTHGTQLTGSQYFDNRFGK